MNETLHQTLLPIALLVLWATTASAQPEEAPSAFSGRIEAGVAFVSTTDQLFASGEDRIRDLDDSADRSTAVLPVVLFDLRYRSRAAGTEVFVGTPLDTDTVGLTLGLVHFWSGVGEVEVAAIANPWSEVWKDPYRVDGGRDATWARQYGGRVAWHGIAETGAEISYTGLHTNVAEDEAGERFETLRRNGWTHEVALGYRIPVAPGAFLVPSAAAILGEFEGDAEAYRGCRGRLSATLVRERVVLNLSVDSGWTRHREEHPLFGERREDGSLGGSALVSLPGLLGVPRLFADLVASYGVRDSNLGFFDADTALGAVALGYTL